jgi:hypothetical protein
MAKKTEITDFERGISRDILYSHAFRLYICNLKSQDAGCKSRHVVNVMNINRLENSAQQNENATLAICASTGCCGCKGCIEIDVPNRQTVQLERY